MEKNIKPQGRERVAILKEVFRESLAEKAHLSTGEGLESLAAVRGGWDGGGGGGDSTPDQRGNQCKGLRLEHCSTG